MLFNKRLLQQNIEKFNFPVNYDFTKAQKIIAGWQTAFKNSDLSKAKETSLQGKFFTKFFCEILGYATQDEGLSEWTLKQESKTEVDGKEADGSLGFYSKEKEQTRVVIELKDAQANLDTKQQSRESKQTPVEQAFQYLNKFKFADWVIVSNFRETRLYHKSTGQTAYESFNILTLNDEKEFKRFYFLLCNQNLLDKDSNSILDKLVRDTNKNEEEISKQFYKDFKILRQDLFQHTCEYNPDIDKKTLLEKTQKLLDRLIFIMFCEDSANLLPANTLKNNYVTAKNLPISGDEKVWMIFKGLFNSIDKGKNDIKPSINAYNGGLFAFDKTLDNLIIKDTVWDKVVKLTEYDFESDLNVNILGHIFEQSLSDLEQLKAEIDCIEQDKSKSKRKKDGIFYTPAYITSYIVEQTVGKYLEENPDKLEFIKILDPACGSGAFLNQAHTFLQKQYKIRFDEQIKDKQQLGLYDYNPAEKDRSILLNNIYGVDLNEESTEITKLALWLKTAKSDQPLQNLDNNIKCGNSLIDDEEIVGKKAFNWHGEFKNIMDNGGFDCIIGNPPYVTLSLGKKQAKCNEQEMNYYKINYPNSLEYKGNLYALFIEKAIKVLKDGGYLSFIIPNTILLSLSFKSIRKYILDNCEIQVIINLKYKVFEDAEIGGNTILVLKKKQNILNISKVLEIKTEEELSKLLSLKDYSDIEQKDFFKNINLEYYTDVKSLKIVNKIKGNSVTFSEIASFYNGIKTGDNKKFISEEKFDSRYTPIIRGRDINRYLLSFNSQYVLFDKNQLWSNFDDSKLSKKPKIIIRQTGDSIIACLDETGYYSMDTTHIIFDTSVNIKYLLTVLNSQPFTWIFRKTVEEESKAFAEVKLAIVKTLPIAQARQEQQENLASKAEWMIELNKNLNESLKQALDFIKEKYNISKPSQKLEKFYQLEANLFIEELKKFKVKLSLSEEEELRNWFKEKQGRLLEIENQINDLDKSIDKEVYELYGLTDEEIKIVEGE